MGRVGLREGESVPVTPGWFGGPGILRWHERQAFIRESRNFPASCRNLGDRAQKDEAVVALKEAILDPGHACWNDQGSPRSE
ncbi:MAG: hypothetical protein ACJAQT_003408 [Akkermansiaceae bacterium]|jgi:hypothetical protein